MPRSSRLLVLACLTLSVGCATTATDTPPGPSARAVAFEAPVSFVSEGDTLRGTVLVAEGAGPHPTVLFLSGFPGRPDPPGFLAPVYGAGYNVLFFPYRGTWGSDGLFSADNVLADAEAALALLRSPEARDAYRIDADAIAVYGTSFGGWTALSLAAADPDLDCVAATVVANVGAFGRQWRAAEPYRAAWRQTFDQMTAELPIRMAGGPAGTMADIMQRADDYDLVPLAPALRDRAVILFGAEQDEVAPIADHYQPVADALRGTGMERLTLGTAPGGHQDPQSEWDAELVEWLREDCFGGR